MRRLFTLLRLTFANDNGLVPASAKFKPQEK
jgi:hypothetical protein